VEVLVALLEPPKQERTYHRPGESKPAIEPSKLGSLVYVYRAKVDEGVTPINLTQVRTAYLLTLNDSLIVYLCVLVALGLQS
jgi:hypothetical protein